MTEASVSFAGNLDPAGGAFTSLAAKVEAFLTARSHD
jgi:hypothetical protein